MIPSLVSLYTRDSGSVQLNTVHTYTADSGGLTQHTATASLPPHIHGEGTIALSVYVHTVVTEITCACASVWVHVRGTCVCVCVCLHMCVCACVCMCMGVWHLCVCVGINTCGLSKSKAFPYKSAHIFHVHSTNLPFPCMLFLHYYSTIHYH